MLPTVSPPVTSASSAATRPARRAPPTCWAVRSATPWVVWPRWRRPWVLRREPGLRSPVRRRSPVCCARPSGCAGSAWHEHSDIAGRAVARGVSGMSVLTSLARLKAMREGVAQPIATVRHFHLAERPMVFIPLKLSGEAAAPLAAMVGTEESAPRLMVVTQPRNRDLRFAFAAELAGVLLPYIKGFLGRTETVEKKNAEPYERVLDAP